MYESRLQHLSIQDPLPENKIDKSLCAWLRLLTCILSDYKAAKIHPLRIHHSIFFLFVGNTILDPYQAPSLLENCVSLF